MPKFIYTAKGQSGEITHGEFEASEKREVAESLRKEGKWAITIEESTQNEQPKISLGSFLGSVPLKNKMMFCRHLGVMISSGLSLSRALIILSSQEKNSYFKKVIDELADEVKKGVSLADAMAKYPAIFDPVFISMVKVGELGGNLENILDLLSEQLEKDYKLVSKVKGAMMYPAVIISVMIVIGILMMMFVVPKITLIFKEFNAQLPVMTRLIIFISDFMSQHVLLVFITLISALGAVKLFSQTTMGIKIFHKIFLKAPVIGAVVSKVNSARFARILSSLLNSGVSLVESLSITADTLGNYYFKKITAKAANDVQKGIPLSQVLKQNEGFFPYLVIQMVEVGEETGKTPEILGKLAVFYEEEVEQITKNLSSIIEPILMVVIGGAVGLFAISIIQPIYSIMDKI